MTEARGRTRDPWFILLLALHVVVGVLAVARSGSSNDSDIHRFTELTSSTGTPWRDFDVEYAPGEALLILALPSDTGWVAATVASVAIVADLTIVVVLRRSWSRTAAVTYLAAMLPLLTFAFARLDLVVVAMTVVATSLLARRRSVAAGVVLGMAVLTKIWPVVLVPLILRGRQRAGRVFVAAIAVGVATWVAWGSLDAVVQVATFRGARGWSVESAVGSVVWIATGGPVTIEAGAPRTGVAALGWRLLLLGGFAVTWWWVFRRIATWEGDRFGVPSLAALGALLLAAPLFSLQYAMWLTPSIAIAWSEERGRRAGVAGLTAVVLTGLEFAILQAEGGGAATRVAILARNLAVLWMTVEAVRALVRNRP